MLTFLVGAASFRVYEVPATSITFPKPRKLSEEQIEAARERLKSNVKLDIKNDKH